MRRRTFMVAAGLAALSGGLASRAKAATALRLGCLPIEADASPFFASDQGMFAKVALDVAITPIANGAAILSAVIGGSLDLGEANLIALAAAHARGLDVACIGGTSVYTSANPTSGLIVAKGSSITTARDLNGKTMAVNGLRNLAHLGSMAWIDKNGGDSSTLQYVDMNFPATLTAVVNGRVDVGIVAEPVLEQARTEARVLADPYTAVAPRFLLGCFFGTTAYLKQNPQTVKRFVEAVRHAGDWANKHRDESARILLTVTKTASSDLAHMTRSTFPVTPLQLAEVQPVIDLAAKYHVIPTTFPAREIAWTG